MRGQLFLHNVSNSVLWLLRFPADDEVHSRESAAALGVSDASRIIFSDLKPNRKRITRVQSADVPVFGSGSKPRPLKIPTIMKIVKLIKLQLLQKLKLNHVFDN